jgi:F-type H+-transporting ATPase subunit gamma
VASAELRQIRRRIRSVESTMKITRAMELIATSRIAKAQVRVQQSQPYIAKMTDVIRNIAAASGGLRHPLLEPRESVNAVGVVVVTSDRGLAGGYNANLIRLAERQVADHQHAGRQVRLYVVGQKAQTYFRYRNYPIEHTWLGVTDTPVYGDARAIANILLNDYEEKAVDAVEVFTTRYLSALTQTPSLWPILPIRPPTAEDAGGDTPGAAYSFEPSPEEILDRLLPRFLEGSIFGVLLEASASEHAARRRAMKAATENAEELTFDLTREANQARQAEITTEISEIVGGAEALSS